MRCRTNQAWDFERNDGKMERVDGMDPKGGKLCRYRQSFLLISSFACRYGGGEEGAMDQKICHRQGTDFSYSICLSIG